MTKIFSYVVARDFGFAPNPFYGYCTLATCKPRIRNAANIGDWIIGNGPKPKKLDDQLIFAMEITEKITYDQYWCDPRFQEKKSFLGGSLKQTYGDNIYHKLGGEWQQENSHHSNANGSINYYNLNRDTKSEMVLISSNFYYFGENSLKIPTRLKNRVCRNMINHLMIEDEKLVQRFLDWIKSATEPGVHGNPRQFKTFERYHGL